MKSFTLSLTRYTILLCSILFTSASYSQTADFNVQHVEDNIGNSGGSASITAVSSLNNAFALANNSPNCYRYAFLL